MWMSVIMRAGPPSMPPPLVDLQRLQGEGSIEAWNQFKKNPINLVILKFCIDV